MANLKLAPSYHIINIIVTALIYTNDLNLSPTTSPSAVEAVVPINVHELKIISNVHMTSGDVTKTVTIKAINLLHCVVACLKKQACLSISYNTLDRSCHVNEIVMSSTDAVVTYDNTYKYTQIEKRLDWHLVFRATHGIGIRVYDTWINAGHHDDVISVTSNTIGCQTVDGRLPCNKHLRTWRLDDWTDVALVKHAFYTDSREVFYVTFDASGTTSTNRDEHFRISNVIDSSATQMVGFSPASVNYNSIEGIPHCHRRFYINYYHNGCGNDHGWVMISESDGCCSYEAVGPFPNFLYTSTTTELNWLSTYVGKAQVFAVFVKYQD